MAQHGLCKCQDCRRVLGPVGHIRGLARALGVKEDRRQIRAKVNQCVPPVAQDREVGAVSIEATDTAAPGDDLTVTSSAKVESTTANVILKAGDDLRFTVDGLGTVDVGID